MGAEMRANLVDNGPDFAGHFDVKRRAAVSVAELLADGVPVHPAEAVAIVRRVCASVGNYAPRVSHPTEIVLLADGELFPGTGRERRMAAPILLSTLLQALLERAPLGHRASRELCEVLARGLTPADAGGFESADVLAKALQPFEGPDSTSDLRALFARWRAVCDLANDLPELPEAAQTVEAVLLDATGSTRRCVVVRKPDRRRYERVVFRADRAPTGLAAETSESVSGDGDTTANSDEPYRARELALASAVLLITVRAGLWFGETLTPFVRHAVMAPPPVVALGSRDVVAGGPDAMAPGPDKTSIGPALDRATTVSAPLSNLASMAMDPSMPLIDGWLLPGLAEPPLRDKLVVDSASTRKANARTRAATSYLRSPDGKRVAFDSNRAGRRAIYIADRDGQNVRRVSGSGLARRPVWSPDSRRLVFERAGRDGTWNLWTVDVGSGDLRQVSFDRNGRPSGVSWFPRGKTIGYSVGSELRIVDLKS